jgi:hypothetical protein
MHFSPKKIAGLTIIFGRVAVSRKVDDDAK